MSKILFKKQTRKHIMVGLILIFLLSLLGCGGQTPSGQAPSQELKSGEDSLPPKQEAGGTPSQELRDRAIKDIIEMGQQIGAPRKDVNMTCTDNDFELTNADRANGISEKWCLGLEFIALDYTGKWHDDVDTLYYYKDKNGEWKDNFGPFPKSNCKCK